jgi:hypothetical protein
VYSGMLATVHMLINSYLLHNPALAIIKGELCILECW